MSFAIMSPVLSISWALELPPVLPSFKSRDITLLIKVHIVKAMVFPIVMYVCESWTIKTECWRIDAFELWCWRLFTVSWTARRSDQSILKEINPEYSLEGLMLMLKLQYFGHPMWRADSLEKPSCWKILKAKGERGGRGWDSCIALLTQWTWIWANSGRWWRTEEAGMCNPLGSQRVRHNLVTEHHHLKLTQYYKSTIVFKNVISVDKNEKN